VGELGKKERAALELLTGRPIEAGDFSGRLWADGFEIEVTVNVRRRPPGDELRQFQAAALAHLAERPYALEHCGCYVTRRGGGWSPSTTHCTGRVVAAVVTRATFPTDALSFLFICGRHRAHHGIDAKKIVATLELTEGLLAPARKALAQRKAEHEARWRKEEAEREAERRAAIAADPKHVHRTRPGGSVPTDPPKCWDCGADLPPAPGPLKLVP
jgi:hypothetical protein